VTSGRTWRADLALAFITLIWGSTFVVVKGALSDASTLLFLALRFTLAAAALALAVRALPARRYIHGGILAGLCLFAGYVLQTAGLRTTTASKSAFITGLSTVITPLLAALVERKIPRAAEVLGVAIATGGLALLMLPGQTLAVSRGDLLTLGCAVAFAAHIVVVDWYSPRLGAPALALTQISTAALLALATFWWVETPSVHWTPRLGFAVAVTGLLATALAFSVQAWAQQRTGPTRTALLFALEPVFAWATAFALTGELLSPRGALGAALILAGVLVVELRRGATA
jgi:drug/metabolite transporter (DMT)-like permease